MFRIFVYLASFLFFTFSTPLFAQSTQVPSSEKPASTYQEKSIRLNGIDLHYLDFGGKGTPLIFLQSFHGDAKEWVDYDFVGFAPSFVNTNRVFSITRRGWGKSAESEVWNLDVAVNGEDLVAFMDAVGLQKAVFLGRIPGNMDMTWLAEHHPERVAGLIYLGMPDIPLRDNTDPDIKALEKAFSTMACDLGPDSSRKTTMRVPYVPHFISNAERRMNVPALQFEMQGELERPRTRHIVWFDGTVADTKDPNFKLCDAGATEYFVALGKDAERQKRLRAELVKLNRTAEYREGFKRAFGKNLRIAVEPQSRDGIASEEAYVKFWKEVLLPFYVKESTAFLSEIK